MNRRDEYDQLYCLLASLSETTLDPNLLEAFNLLAVQHRPTRWVPTEQLDHEGRHAAAAALLTVLRASPTGLRETLDLDTLADLIGGPR